MVLHINQLMRYTDEQFPADKSIDGFPNFWFLTHTEDGLPQARLRAGISQMKTVKSDSVDRRPAIMIRSSPYRAGSSSTPWHDSFDMDRGRVRYFGDTKFGDMPHVKVRGNKILRALFDQSNSPDRQARANTAPLLFFVAPRQGFVEFRGVGLIERVELVAQVDNEGRAFSNYAFDCALVDLSAEGEQLDWGWISARKDPDLSDEAVLELAPKQWSKWVNEGKDSLSSIRRNVARAKVFNKEEQLPPPGSEEQKVLDKIYNFYSTSNDRKKRFEALAEVVTEFVISESHGRYKRGWVTRGSGDHGIDFVGRLDVGSGFSTTSLVVLGQAKCEKPNSTTSGQDIARTVARLRRGWIGCYVTTGTFSKPNQQEVIEDRYPLILVPGAKVAEAVKRITVRDGLTVDEFLKRVDSTYEKRLVDRDPEQVLDL